MLAAPLGEGDATFVQLVLHSGLAVAGGFAQRPECLGVGDEVVGTGNAGQAELAAQRAVALRFAESPLPLAFAALDLETEPFDAVAAVVADGPAQLALFGSLAEPLVVEAGDLAAVARQFFLKSRQSLLQQPRLAAGKVGAQRVARGAHLVDADSQGLVAVAVGEQRRQQLDLALGLEDRFVGAV